MSKIRIIYVIDRLHIGGAELQTLYLLQHLDRTRFDPIVVVIHATDPNAATLHDEIKVLNIPIYSLDLSDKMTSRWKTILRFIRGVLAYSRLTWRLRPQIVQSVLHTANLIARIGRLFSPPHIQIATIRSVYPENKLRAERLTAFLSSCIVVTSNLTSQHMLSHGKIRHGKLTTIFPGIVVERFAEKRNLDALVNQYGDGFIAIMVARIDDRKDHSTLIRALEILYRDEKLSPSFRMLLIGDAIIPGQEEILIGLIGEQGLMQYIIRITHASDLAPYYQLADVAILPSKTEAFGVVVIEALSAGTPVIVSSEVARTGVFQDDCGWSFPTGNAAALAKSIDYVMSLSDKDRKAIGKNGQSFSQKFNLAHYVQQYVTLYEASLSQQTSGKHP